MRFENEVVVVTGAASGIGRAVALASAAEGAKVAVLDMNEEAGAALAGEIGGLFVPCDVGDGDQWKTNAQTIFETLGAPARVHLNAGIMSAAPGQPNEQYRFSVATPERYRRLMSVNVDGVVYGLQALLPHMSEGSSIVLTASLAGLVPYDPIYSMTKHAVVGLARSLAGELRTRGIRINAICPGAVDTAIIPSFQEHPNVPMPPDELAADVLNLFDGEGSGDAWARVREDKPAYVMYPPGPRPRE